ncbi:hypothetical protein EDD18DRAFT_1440725 [Armillaria luteobubalina]|uniref:Uncharacterized protein n=1 Tax=Armillaria luteobubalina TaxID=153913 RepID=A0AA39P8Z6_9AGAR|nr:hypothetical protein EDD18DRAFT_1440725 [Armillaria luteobubalina]
MDTTQLDGTIEVTFPGSGEYTVEAITNQTGVVTIAAAQRFEVLARYGGTRWSNQCEEELRQLTAFDATAPLQIAPYIVAFHHDTRVRMIGLYTSETARAVYDAISMDWAKVVSDREHSKRLASYGEKYYTKLCKYKISELDAFNSNILLKYASYVVAWHQSDRVKMAGFSSEGPARAVYNAVSNL